MSTATMASFGPVGGRHVVDSTVTGAHLVTVHKAIRQGELKDTFTLANQSAADWVVRALQQMVAMPVKDTLWIVRQSFHLLYVMLHRTDHAAGASCLIPIMLVWSA